MATILRPKLKEMSNGKSRVRQVHYRLGHNLYFVRPKRAACEAVISVLMHKDALNVSHHNVSEMALASKTTDD